MASSPKLTQNQNDDFKTSRIDASSFEMTHGLKVRISNASVFADIGYAALTSLYHIVSTCSLVAIVMGTRFGQIWAVYGTILPLFWHVLQLMTKELKQLPGSMCCYMQWFNPSVLVCLLRWLDDPCFSTRNFMSRVIVSGFSFL